MSIHRVRIDINKSELVKSLVQDTTSQGPFQTYADVLVFAAGLGMKYDLRNSVITVAKEPNPISWEIFVSRGYDWFIQLLAIATTNDPYILTRDDLNTESQRLLIFEEYANGGLGRLRDELRGSVNYTDTIALMLHQERSRDPQVDGEFDLTRFL